MKSVQLWAVVCLMAVTLGVLELRGDTDQVPPSAPLAQLPGTMAGLQAHDIAIPQETLDVLGKGQFLNRIYDRGDGNPLDSIGLFIGYFPTQRSGQSIHSPQNCLPGAGWNFDTSGTTEVHSPEGTARVGEYVISNGTYRQEVLYWYRSHGRNIASDYAAKFHMLKDSILYGRTDAALVRVITPIGQGESVAAAHARAVGFTERLMPMLPAYIPN